MHQNQKTIKKGHTQDILIFFKYKNPLKTKIKEGMLHVIAREISTMFQKNQKKIITSDAILSIIFLRTEVINPVFQLPCLDNKTKIQIEQKMKKIGCCHEQYL